MNNELPRRGGSHTFEGLEAETLGHQAAAKKIARSANPYGAGGELAKVWDAAHCRASGVDMTAPTETVTADAKPAEGRAADKTTK